jgi:hypothetical protein
MSLLALGVSIRWAEAGPADFTPLLSMMAAVLVVRFVVGLRLGPITAVAAAGAGAAWAAAVPPWGIALPTLVVIVATAGLRAWADRTRPA